jgi:hypothetical protein
MGKLLILFVILQASVLELGSPHRQNCPLRQILPGRLRLVNQKKAKLCASRASRDHHAHLRTERHHSRISGGECQAEQFIRLCFAGRGVSPGGARCQRAQSSRQH